MHTSPEKQTYESSSVTDNAYASYCLLTTYKYLPSEGMCIHYSIDGIIVEGQRKGFWVWGDSSLVAIKRERPRKRWEDDYRHCKMGKYAN